MDVRYSWVECNISLITLCNKCSPHYLGKDSYHNGLKKKPLRVISEGQEPRIEGFFEQTPKEYLHLQVSASDALCLYIRSRELESIIRSQKLTLNVESYANAATKALPATTPHSPNANFSAPPVVGEAVAAVPVVEAVVFELSVPLAFIFASEYLVAVTPVPLVQRARLCGRGEGYVGALFDLCKSWMMKSDT